MSTSTLVIIIILGIALVLIGVRAYIKKNKDDGKGKIYPLW